ncbi:MAG: hypothetical protein KDA44_02475 [Planctomycetales bacterium]|nr:hypothetical protein [Planctomycetales bacterium]
MGSTAWSSGYVARLQSEWLGDYGFRIPTGSAQQLAPLAWVNIDQISITFSEDVAIQSNDLSLSSSSLANLAFSGFMYDPQAFVATWTLSAPLTSDAYQIDLDGDGVGRVTAQWTGVALDGEWIDGVSTFASGDGLAGGDFEFQFRVLTGDGDHDEGVVWSDLYETFLLDGTSLNDPDYDLFRDLEGDGVIDDVDFADVWTSYGQEVETSAPLGETNDAPSVKGIATKKLFDPAANVNVSLYAAFSDVEDSDANLQFTVSNSNSALFDAVSFDPNTGNLTLSAAEGASGRAEFTVTATDSGGRQTTQSFWADVNYVDQPPVLTFAVDDYSGGFWFLGGSVSDADDVVEGMYVYLFGAIQAKAAVKADGTWGFAAFLDPADWDFTTAIALDPHGTPSNAPQHYVGW